MPERSQRLQIGLVGYETVPDRPRAFGLIASPAWPYSEALRVSAAPSHHYHMHPIAILDPRLDQS